MYIPNYFRNKNLPELENFIRQNPFAILINQYEGKPLATHIPVELEKNESGENVLLAGLSDNALGAMEMSIADEDGKTVGKALGKLPLLYREVLTLRYGQELTFEEIGEVLKRPMNTVKSQHRRGLAELRKIIDNAPK